jgi:hypothetical protein
MSNTYTYTHNLSGIYKLKCNTCNGVYVGQSGRSINVKYKEHIRYIRTNNSTSAYEAHILMYRHKHTVSILYNVIWTFRYYNY